MFDKLSTIKIRPAWLASRVPMGRPAQLMGDRTAIRAQPGAEIRIRDTAWEDHYDALGG